MSVWARSDVGAVSISRDHGGCGVTHSRPVVKGAPVRVWSLTCHDGCEDVLRSDPLWSGTPQGVPETPDEVAIREDVERRGQLEQQRTTAEALHDLAKLGDLPSAIAQLAQIMAGQQSQQLVSGMDVMCRSGHRNRPGAKFCSACGASMGEPVAADRGPALLPAEVDAVESAEEVSPVELPADLEALSLPELREVAARLGVKAARSKTDQIAAIREAAA